MNMRNTESNRHQIRVFVYGTLMRGQRAHHFLEGAEYLGEFILDNYAIYDLGSFPGIKPKNDHRVFGEVYEIVPEMLPTLDRYEGEGSLYDRVKVSAGGDAGTVEAYAYVYKGNPGSEPLDGKWGTPKKDYVWYACYGSNLSADRFRCYIEGGLCKENGNVYTGCRKDRSLWTDSRIRRYPGRIYFANKSSAWEEKGVAFYDPDAKGETIMRLYRITKEQLQEVQKQEGLWPQWYGRMIELGTEDGLPVYTITNEVPITRNAPSEKYLSLIRRALIQECGVPEDEAEEYLADI